MPATFAHPIFAPPLARLSRGWMPLSALVVGCVTPDAEYFLTLGPHSVYGHTIPGIFYWDLPVGLVLLVLFHLLVRDPILLLLPDGHRRRLERVEPMEWRSPSRALGICCALIVGAATHVALDAMTHPHRWFVRRVALLRYRIDGFLPVYTFLQFGFSVLFTGVLALLYVRWYRSAEPAPDRGGLPLRARAACWVTLLLFVPLAGLLNGLRLAKVPGAWLAFLMNTVIGAMTACVVFTVVFSLAVRATGVAARSIETEQP